MLEVIEAVKRRMADDFNDLQTIRTQAMAARRARLAGPPIPLEKRPRLGKKGSLQRGGRGRGA